MKLIISFLLFCLPYVCFCQLPDRVIYDLKTGRIKDNITNVYLLPYKNGSKYLFIQGANSNFSHKGELAYDFKMKIGSKICAARAGKVIEVKYDSERGGLKDEYLSDGNHIIIEHDDGSTALYWHLKYNGVLVKKLDTVTKGQLIGLSGNTGYTAFPHLHFQLLDKNGKEILARFTTKKGVVYLRPGRRYKSVHN
jgi:murein DD-endopeptidase MepM/ murein hydrolase activator NlpD